MKTIRSYFNLAEAGFASSLLEAAGIPAVLKGEQSFLMTPGIATGGIELQVPEEDTEKARRVLDKGFDADDVQGSAPSEQIEQEAPASADEVPNPSPTKRGQWAPAHRCICPWGVDFCVLCPDGPAMERGSRMAGP